MFNISAKGIYGLSAMLELAIHYGQGSIRIKEIAKTHKIPQHFLEQLLITLKKTGLIISFRGYKGGYSLAKHPSKIMVSEILLSLEGKFEINSKNHKPAALKYFLSNCELKIKNIFNVSLKDIIDEYKKIKRVNMYNI